MDFIHCNVPPLAANASPERLEQHNGKENHGDLDGHAAITKPVRTPDTAAPGGGHGGTPCVRRQFPRLSTP